MKNYILAIDTSADDTCAAVVQGRKVISHVEYSQVSLHTQWGGIYPSVAKRAHQEHIDLVIQKAIKNSGLRIDQIDAVAVTYGPGLAIALEVGIRKAKDICLQFNKPLIPVNHMEGHLYSSFIQNSAGNPAREFAFPILGLLVSGGHTELILFKDHLTYEILGETLDDAAGESLDKAARMLGFGYPGGPVIERIANEIENEDIYKFPRPMWKSREMDFSYSGLKTAFLYFLQKMDEKEKLEKLPYLASSFQEAVYASLLQKTEMALKKYDINRMVLGGGVAVNRRLRFLIRKLMLKYRGSVYFPPYKYLNFDNAAMIGIVGSYRYEKGLFAKQIENIERVPRLTLTHSSIDH